MYSRTGFAVRLSASLAIVALAACSQQSPSVAPASVAYPQRIANDAFKTPAPCKGQKTTKRYAEVEERLESSGGAACVPSFGGFGGDIAYPNLNPSIDVHLIGSTSNYDGLPELGSGTAIFYIQLTTSGGTSFGRNVPKGGPFVGATIVPSKPYTAFGQASAYGIKRNLTPCYAIAKKSAYGGAIDGLGTLLRGQDIPSAISGVVEIYPGKQASLRC